MESLLKIQPILKMDTALFATLMKWINQFCWTVGIHFVESAGKCILKKDLIQIETNLS